MRVLVTGGAGFIGAAVVKRLVEEGEDVVVLDNCHRGSWANLPERGYMQYEGDIRELQDVCRAMRGVDEVIHLAYINGTKTFYESPGLVLDVAVNGMSNVIKACRKYNVKRFMLASSSEVCRAHIDGMDEGIPLVIPDPMNPRYSYSAGKIISEMIAIHCKQFDWLTIFRPFNIYGPGMSAGHVIPDFEAELKRIAVFKDRYSVLSFKILGSGDETRSFCYIDDFIDGLMLIRARGQHMGIYNIGTPQETTIRSLALRMASFYGLNISIQEGLALPEGSIKRRKPNITKLAVLGYSPKVTLDEGLRRVLCQ